MAGMFLQWKKNLAKLRILVLNRSNVRVFHQPNESAGWWAAASFLFLMINQI